MESDGEGLEAAVAEEENAEDGSDDIDTGRGAAAIIYNSKTGEFYFELKPDSYPIQEARGKLALVGGHVDPSDPTSLDALIREIGEEVVDKRAQKILSDRVTELGTYYYTLVEFIDGRWVETDVYLISIESDIEWAIVKNSALTEGRKQVLTYLDVLGRLNDFAFKYEKPLKKLLNENKDIFTRTTSYPPNNYKIPVLQFAA